MESARLLTEEEAERRIIMLVNPNLKAPQTTDSSTLAFNG